MCKCCRRPTPALTALLARNRPYGFPYTLPPPRGCDPTSLPPPPPLPAPFLLLQASRYGSEPLPISHPFSRQTTCCFLRDSPCLPSLARVWGAAPARSHPTLPLPSRARNCMHPSPGCACASPFAPMCPSPPPPRASPHSPPPLRSPLLTELVSCALLWVRACPCAAPACRGLRPVRAEQAEPAVAAGAGVPGPDRGAHPASGHVPAHKRAVCVPQRALWGAGVHRCVVCLCVVRVFVPCCVHVFMRVHCMCPVLACKGVAAFLCNVRARTVHGYDREWAWEAHAHGYTWGGAHPHAPVVGAQMCAATHNTMFVWRCACVGPHTPGFPLGARVCCSPPDPVEWLANYLLKHNPHKPTGSE